MKCPTLLVAAGGRSHDTPASLQRKQRRIEQVEGTQALLDYCVVEWIENTGHDIGYEKPEQLASVLKHFFKSEET